MENSPRAKSFQQKICPPLPNQKIFAYSPITNKTRGKFYKLKTFPQGL
jgi:hypothetical protein